MCNTKGYSSTYLAMGFANVRAGTQKRRAVLLEYPFVLSQAAALYPELLGGKAGAHMRTSAGASACAHAQPL